MSKTIEEIKEEVSRYFLHPYRTWLENSRFSNDDNISVLEDYGAIDEVVKRYAQSQTQELQEQNAELVMTLETIASLITSQTSMSTVQASLLQVLTKHNHLIKKP